MAGECSQGSLSLLLVEPDAGPHTFDSSSEAYEFLYENLRKHGRIVGGRGIRGTRSSQSERTRIGAYAVYGTIAMNVSPVELDLWLPRILGAAEVPTDVFGLAETLPQFGVLKYLSTDASHTKDTLIYTNCKVNRALIRGRAMPEEAEPELLELILEIFAESETADSSYSTIVSPPSPSTAANAAVYIMADGALTLLAASREAMDFQILIDNHLEPRWSIGSLTATAICARDRTITGRFTLPWTSNEDDLYNVALAGSAGATLVFTNGNMSTTFTFGTLQWPDNSPTVPGKREIPLHLETVARKVTTTNELVVTNDSTV